jgi:hypothetical protein
MHQEDALVKRGKGVVLKYNRQDASEEMVLKGEVSG